jgi:hypothetical protein
VEHKFSKQRQCDSHCYKAWYDYNNIMGESRCDELDTLFAVDLLCHCDCNKISCSFVDEVKMYNRQEYCFIR